MMNLNIHYITRVNIRPISSVSDRLERIITSPRNTVYVAEQDDQLVGYAFITTEDFERKRHEAVITIGVDNYIRNMA